MSEDIKNEQPGVSFSGQDIFLLIGHLAQAVTYLATATSHLAVDRNADAMRATTAAGEQVDEILKALRTKLGDTADER